MLLGTSALEPPKIWFRMVNPKNGQTNSNYVFWLNLTPISQAWPQRWTAKDHSMPAALVDNPATDPPCWVCCRAMGDATDRRFRKGRDLLAVWTDEVWDAWRMILPNLWKKTVCKWRRAPRNPRMAMFYLAHRTKAHWTWIHGTMNLRNDFLFALFFKMSPSSKPASADVPAAPMDFQFPLSTIVYSLQCLQLVPRSEHPTCLAS